MSQINLSPLTAFLNTSFKTLLVVATICLSAVIANAAEFAPNGEQDKISQMASVIVTGKNYTHNLTLANVAEVDMTKLVSFKTPKDMKSLDVSCAITIPFIGDKNKTAKMTFTLPVGWENTAEQNNAIKATLKFTNIGEDDTTVKFNAKSGDEAITVTNDQGDPITSTVTEFVAGKTVKDQATTGGVITVKIPSNIKPNNAPFTVTNASFVVKDIVADSDKVIGEFKLSFKNDKDFAGIETVILTATHTDMKLFTDKKLTTAFTPETITKKTNEFYPNFEKTLYFKVDSASIEALTYKGLTKSAIFTVTERINQNPQEKEVTADVIITTKETNYVTLKLSKTELKDIKVNTAIVGTIEFKNKLATDITYDLEGTDGVSGVTFSSATIELKKDQKKATFKVTFAPNTDATTFAIKAKTTDELAAAANIFNDVTELTETVNVTTFKEVNGFVPAAKGVTVTLKKNLVVRIPFKFQKPVKEQVGVQISVAGGALNGTDFADKTITVEANKNSFFVEFEIKDITKFDGMGAKTIFTATVSEGYPGSGLTQNLTTTNTLITTDLVSKFLTADLSWTVEGGKPTAEQLNATSAIPAGSDIKLKITMASAMGKTTDESLLALVTKALEKTQEIPFLVKFDKNAEMALGKSELTLDVPLKTPEESADLTNIYCASKKLKGTVTISTTAKGIKILNKKATFLIGDDLDLDPFAVPMGDYSSEKFTLVSKNAYTSVVSNNFEIENEKLMFKANPQSPTVLNTSGETATKSANIKMYVGTGVAKDETYTANKTDFLSNNAAKELITVAPSLSFYVCDPITNPNELKPAKKIALKTPKGKDFDQTAANIDYTIPSAPIVYNKKELANYRKAGGFFSLLDSLADTMIQPKQGFVGGTVKMAWKQGKKNEAGYIDAKESADISVVVFAPATIATITGDSLKKSDELEVAFNFSSHNGMVLIDADTVVIDGKFLTAKTTLSAEYLDGSAVKVVSFKFGKDDVKFDAITGKISYKINKTTAKAFAKLKNKEFYLILDNGSALTSPNKTFKFGDKFFN